ncbi:MAG: hypothetical protein OXC46_12120 [Thaumarchaeota archaeon]|nr:hypothetical protein [Nitrososphaerota archaeon]
MLEKQFDANALYNRIVHYYMDKKGFTKDKANSIAQTVVLREAKRKMCKNKDCGHFLHDHMRNSETCLVSDCVCGRFTR